MKDPSKRPDLLSATPQQRAALSKESEQETAVWVAMELDLNGTPEDPKPTPKKGKRRGTRSPLGKGGYLPIFGQNQPPTTNRGVTIPKYDPKGA